MGSWCRSFSFRGNVASELLATMDLWMRAKGLERVESAEARLLAPHERDERGAFLVWNSKWTVLVYSDFEEEERLVYELSRNRRPLLRFMIVDSDVWAYQLYQEGEIVSAFRSSSGIWGDIPGGPNDLERLRGDLQIEQSAAELRRLQRGKGPLADIGARRFLGRLGLSAAITQFDYIRQGENEFPGFEVRELRYQRPGFDAMRGFDLHRIKRREPALVEIEDEMPPGGTELLLPLHLRLLIGLFRVLVMLLKPFNPLFGWILRRRAMAVVEHGVGDESASDAGVEATVEPLIVIEDGYLIHRTMGFRMHCPEGTELTSAFGLLRWRGFDVRVSISRPDHVRDALTGWRRNVKYRTEDFFAGELPARLELVEDNGPRGNSRWACCYLSSTRGVYRFDYSPRFQKAGEREASSEGWSDELIRDWIEPLKSFELLDLSGSQPAI